MAVSFDHEKLQIYQRALDFIVLVEAILEKLPKRVAGHDQLERASTSIPLNIAEGKGKFTSADRCRFFDIARGSALECAATLDVLSRGLVSAEAAAEGKEMLREIVSMLVGLIRSHSKDRVYEEQGAYNFRD